MSTTTPIDPTTTTDRATAAPERTGPGVIKRTTRTVTRITLLVVGIAVGLFAAVNTRDVSVSWIFGDPLQTPLILVIAISLAAGLILGWLGSTLRHHRS